MSSLIKKKISLVFQKERRKKSGYGKSLCRCNDKRKNILKSIYYQCCNWIGQKNCYYLVRKCNVYAKYEENEMAPFVRFLFLFFSSITSLSCTKFYFHTHFVTPIFFFLSNSLAVIIRFKINKNRLKYISKSKVVNITMKYSSNVICLLIKNWINSCYITKN